MDISLERRFLSSFKLIGSAKKVCDVSSDIVVPDTREDILRVIMTNADYSIRSKDVESGRVVVHGELKATVVYVPEMVLAHLARTFHLNVSSRLSLPTVAVQ